MIDVRDADLDVAGGRNQPHCDIRRRQQRRAAKGARQEQPRRIRPDEGAHQMRRDEADEADGARHRHRGADAESHGEDDDEAKPADIEAEAFGGLLAESQQAEALPMPRQQRGRDHNEGQRQHDMADAAVFQRSEQPEGDLQGREGIGREVHRQRGPRSGQAGDREPGEDQQKQRRIAARHGQQQEDRGEGAEDRGDRQAEGERRVEAERDRRDGREGGGLWSAEQRRIRQRIAQQSLHRRAAEAEGSADGESEDRAGQADFHDDDAAGIVRRGGEGGEDIARREADRARAEREDRERDHQQDERRKRPAAFSERLVRRVHHVARKPA